VSQSERPAKNRFNGFLACNTPACSQPEKIVPVTSLSVYRASAVIPVLLSFLSDFVIRISDFPRPVDLPPSPFKFSHVGFAD
jgi:hypothetical protein